MAFTSLQRSVSFLFTATLSCFGCVSLAIGQQNSVIETAVPSPSSLAEDPFRKSDSPQPVRKEEPSVNDPFDQTLGEVAKTRNEPIPFASLPAEELAKMEEKIRKMRISVLNNAIEVIREELQTGTDRVGLMREYAELFEEVTTLEFQKAKSSVERQAAIQRAIDAWRYEEKNVSDIQEGARTALAIYFGSRYRLRWELALVKELRTTAEAKSASASVVQSIPIQSTIVTPQTVYYPSVQQGTIVEQPSSTYYYPRQQTYPYSRSYRTR